MSRHEARNEAHRRWVQNEPRWPQLAAHVKRTRAGVYEVGYCTMWGGRPHATLVRGRGDSWEAAFADADSRP